jgi:hypothetical protein
VGDRDGAGDLPGAASGQVRGYADGQASGGDRFVDPPIDRPLFGNVGAQRRRVWWASGEREVDPPERPCDADGVRTVPAIGGYGDFD